MLDENNKKKPDFKKLGSESFLIIPHVCRRLVCRLYERLCVMCLFNVYIYIKYFCSVKFQYSVYNVTKLNNFIMDLIF